MMHELDATTPGAEAWASRLRSARNASPSISGVASKDGLSNSIMEADEAPKPILCPAERFKMMDLRPRPWPKATQPAPEFVLCGNSVDKGLKMQLWALLSSGMVTLQDHVSDSSFGDEARWRKERWLPPTTGHSKREILRQLWDARAALRRVLKACAAACNLPVPPEAVTTDEKKARKDRR